MDLKELNEKFDQLADNFINFAIGLYKKYPNVISQEMDEKFDKSDLLLYDNFRNKYKDLLLEADRLAENDKSLKMGEFAKILSNFNEKIMLEQFKSRGVKVTFSKCGN